MFLRQPTYQIFNILLVPNITAELLWDITFLFIGLGVLYFVFIFLYRNRLTKLDGINKRTRQELAPVVSNFLFHTEDNPKDEKKQYVEFKIEIRDYLCNKGFRKIIAQILFDLQKDVAGETRERLFKLYKELELHHDAFKKLESWRWETVSQGILELSQMEVQESYQLIRNFINDRRGVVRKQAELATVSLRENGIDFLLDTTKHAISEWQQLKIIELLAKRNNYRPPEFKSWLVSQNNDVVLFALRLIKHYNQKSAQTSITELVKHKDDVIKVAAIECIVDFNFTDAITTLKKVFWKTATTVQINILNAIANLGSEEELLFLKQVASQAFNFVIVSKAQSTINKIVPETFLPSKDIMEAIEEPVPCEKEETAKKTPKQKRSLKILKGKWSKKKNAEVEQEQNDGTITVEDIEFFDEVEFSEPKTVEDKSFEPSEPAFEIKSIEEDFGTSMDQILGLVATSDADMDSYNLVETYHQITTNQKADFIENIADKGQEKELPLLEHITENEEDSELRYQAFKKLKTIKAHQEKPSMANNLTREADLSMAQWSVFYQLYHYTDEVDAKLILIREMMEIGEEREIAFLKTLLEEKNTVIVKLAKQAISILTTKQSETAGTHKNIENKKVSATLDDQLQPQESIPVQDNRLPMELFMLYDNLGIRPSDEEKEEFTFFDFSLSEDYFNNNDLD